MCISMQFPAEINSKGSKTPTFIHFHTTYNYSGILAITVM